MPELVPSWVNGRLMPIDKLLAHQRGLRHMAVSVFVMDGDRTLIQRRAAGKYHTPGLWANSCCTHPRWKEEPLACAKRRLAEELGIFGVALRAAGQVEYRADVGNGLTEHEVVDLFIGHAGPDLKLSPDPDEVWETRWIALDALIAEIAAEPARFTPWLRIYLTDHLGLLQDQRLHAAQ